MRLGDEAHFLDARLLAGQDHPAHRFEAHILVAADMHFRETSCRAAAAVLSVGDQPLTELRLASIGVSVLFQYMFSFLSTAITIFSGFVTVTILR